MNPISEDVGQLKSYSSSFAGLAKERGRDLFDKHLLKGLWGGFAILGVSYQKTQDDPFRTGDHGVATHLNSRTAWKHTNPTLRICKTRTANASPASLRMELYQIRQKLQQEIIQDAKENRDLKNELFVGLPELKVGHAIVPIVALNRKLISSVPTLNNHSPWDFFDRTSLVHESIAAFLRVCSNRLLTLARRPPLFEKTTVDLLREAGHWLAVALTRALWKDKNGHRYFDHLNAISALSYEGQEGCGRIVFGSKDHPAIRCEARLRNAVGYSKHRSIRKLLEIAGHQSGDGRSEKKVGSEPRMLFGCEGVCKIIHKLLKIVDYEWGYGMPGEEAKGEPKLLFDREGIYGIGTVDYSAYDCNEESVFEVDFLGGHEWSLLHVDQPLMSVKHEQPSLPIKLVAQKPTEADFTHRLAKVFESSSAFVDENALWKVISHAMHQKHGTMVVISSEASKEAKRLGNQGTPIEPLSLLESRLTLPLTSIDGALMLSPDGKCHAMGVILDGVATPHGGNSGRGARYNSAGRYANYVRDEGHTCLIVCVSEDGMVDLFDSLLPGCGHVFP